jgi:hypothetical protein
MYRKIALSLWERGDREAVGEGTTPAGVVTQFRNPQNRDQSRALTSGYWELATLSSGATTTPSPASPAESAPGCPAVAGPQPSYSQARQPPRSPQEVTVDERAHSALKPYAHDGHRLNCSTPGNGQCGYNRISAGSASPRGAPA